MVSVHIPFDRYLMSSQIFWYKRLSLVIISQYVSWYTINIYHYISYIRKVINFIPLTSPPFLYGGKKRKQFSIELGTRYLSPFLKFRILIMKFFWGKITFKYVLLLKRWNLQWWKMTLVLSSSIILIKVN